jgi:hypothetical protein
LGRKTVSKQVETGAEGQPTGLPAGTPPPTAAAPGIKRPAARRAKAAPGVNGDVKRLSARGVVRFVLTHGGRTSSEAMSDPPAPAASAEAVVKKRSSPLRFIDLFCGIGGFRHAFERAGAKCVFSSDWDKFSRQTYAANFGEEPAGDINAVPVADIPPFDILCGGFPCQPFSLAGVSKKNSLGKKHGFDDERQGNLFFAIADILQHHQPPAFVLENVKHLTRHDKGRTSCDLRETLRTAA